MGNGNTKPKNVMQDQHRTPNMQSNMMNAFKKPISKIAAIAFAMVAFVSLNVSAQSTTLNTTIGSTG